MAGERVRCGGCRREPAASEARPRADATTGAVPFDNTGARFLLAGKRSQCLFRVLPGRKGRATGGRRPDGRREGCRFGGPGGFMERGRKLSGNGLFFLYLPMSLAVRVFRRGR